MTPNCVTNLPLTAELSGWGEQPGKGTASSRAALRERAPSRRSLLGTQPAATSSHPLPNPQALKRRNSVPTRAARLEAVPFPVATKIVINIQVTLSALARLNLQLPE